jgi:nicotinamidase-related amidase
MRSIHLLIIDPQNDFCDPNGSLYVDGAEKDMDRLAVMISRLKDKLDDIHVTLDSHRNFDVAHPIYWQDSNGSAPAPFTVIKAGDLKKGSWNTSLPHLYDRTLSYLEALEQGNRYDLMVWPPHCLIGSGGHNSNPKVLDALFEWESHPGNMVDVVTKGSNPFTEHYSAIQAEVPDPNDTTTQINTALIKTLMEADEVLIAGEALSHCLKSTVEDIANNFGDNSYIAKMTLLTDCSSPVAGFEKQSKDFVANLTSRGMRIGTSDSYLI